MDRHKLLWINFFVLLMQGWNIATIGKFTALPRSHTLCMLKNMLEINFSIFIRERSLFMAAGGRRG